MLDNVIIEQQLSLATSPYKFRLKSKASRALCTTMIVGILLGISYHLEKRNHSVCLLLLDASKAFDKVSFDISFKLLLKKLWHRVLFNHCYIIMYVNHKCYVK